MEKDQNETYHPGKGTPSGANKDRQHRRRKWMNILKYVKSTTANDKPGPVYQ